MGVSLSKLITDVGTAVQNANAAIEEYAAETYLRQGYICQSEAETENGTGAEFSPVTYTLNVPAAGGKKKLLVPATALMNHSTLALEQVDVKLKFVLEEGNRYDDEVIVKVKSAENANLYSISELSLQFKSSPPSEGTARLENHHIQTL